MHPCITPQGCIMGSILELCNVSVFTHFKSYNKLYRVHDRNGLTCLGNEGKQIRACAMWGGGMTNGTALAMLANGEY